MLNLCKRIKAKVVNGKKVPHVLVSNSHQYLIKIKLKLVF